LLRGRWKKMVWNLPFNGISVAMGGITVDKIVTDPDLRKLADTVMDEVIATANSDLERKHGKGSFDALGDAEKKMMMGLSDVSISVFANWVNCSTNLTIIALNLSLHRTWERTGHRP
jgi:hypothetical protein